MSSTTSSASCSSTSTTTTADDKSFKTNHVEAAAAAVDPYEYQVGMGSGEFHTEALPNALPRAGLLTPQKCAYGLVAEQINGTSFTTPRVHNQRTWAYRIRPASGHSKFVRYDTPNIVADFNVHGQFDANQRRWMPLPFPEKEGVTFVDGLVTYAGAGSPSLKVGFAIHLYACNASMKDSCFANSDGDMLIVPQCGTLDLITELGILRVAPNEICVVPRGIRFAVKLVDELSPARGYVCEIYEGHFKIPDLGPIGANGLAQPRDFRTPVAYYEDRDNIDFTLIQKFAGECYTAKLTWSPFDVVAWTGNYAPYKYNLSHFVVVNSVSRDHLDPSIFTVITAQTAAPGVACIDFVIFPPRWAVQEETFRPPYFHRNTMSEFMGLITGVYEAKEKGFLPGGATLHNTFTAHGPETQVFEKASNAPLTPMKIAQESQAFMFESTYMMKLTPFAYANLVDEDYYKCWQGMPHKFDPTRPEPPA